MSELPDGLYKAVKLSRLAAALGLPEGTVRRWADRGKHFDLMPTPPGCARYIAVDEIARLEREGWPVDWAVLLE
jgi:hypothetical protein